MRAPDPKPTPAWWPWVAFSGAALLFWVAFVVRTGFRWRGQIWWTLFDDAMISMRYARNLAAGHGFVWNAGEPPVEGFTNTLWMLWMAALHGLPLGERLLPLTVALSGVVVLAILAWLAYRLAGAVGGGPAARAASLILTALAYPVVYWTLRGMEVGLGAVWLLASAWLAFDPAGRRPKVRALWVALVLVLGLLTRMDLAPALLLAAGGLVLGLERHRLWAISVILAALFVTVLALTVWRLDTFGEPLPNTYYLKMTGVPLWERLERGAAVTLPHVLRLSPLLLLAGIAAWDPARRRTVGLLVAIFFSFVFYSVWVGGDAWEWMGYSNRYVATGLPVLLVAAAVGLERLAQAVVHRTPTLLPSVSSLARRLLPASVALGAAVGLYALLPLLGMPWLGGGPGAAAWAAAAWLAVTAVVLGTRAMGRAQAFRLGAVGAIYLAWVTWGGAFATWFSGGGYYVPSDAEQLVRGVILRESTTEDVTVAFVWAGTAAYHSHRPARDLLGKTDPRIARAGPRTPFFPGHDRWDLAVSLADRPGLVMSLPGSVHSRRREVEDAERMADFGYVEGEQGIWVHEDLLVRAPHLRAMEWPSWSELYGCGAR